MSAPRITVLVPVRNGAHWLPESLASVWNQTYTDFELLVVDDASTDETAAVLDAVADPRLRVLRNETRLKLAGALNRGIAAARGEWIARMDADDRMRPDRMARQIRHMRRHPDLACCGGWVRTFGDQRAALAKYPVSPAQVKAYALFYNPFAHPTVMFRRDWFLREQFQYDGAFYPAEDYALWASVLARFPCGNIPSVLLDYRVHNQSMTGAEWDDMELQSLRVQRIMLEGLGFMPTEEECQLHRAASMGRLPPVPESFVRAEDWLVKLADVNREAGIYEPAALADILNYVLFRTAMAVVRDMGDAAWQAYRTSRLAYVGRHGVVHRWAVRLAALKADLKRRRS